MAARKREKRRREESAKEEISPESFQLPPEIIREILVRLPAKSIGRCRCVSKLFCSLSSDRGFAKRHLDLTVHRKLIVFEYNLLYALDFDGIGIGDVSGGGVTDLVGVELNYPRKVVPSDEMVQLSPKPYGSEWVYFNGYSNGLVCISLGDGAVFLYNPTTGDSKRLPELAGEENDHETHGFCFDDLTNDYKVVKLVADDYYRVVHASVYSLKADSWRRVCDLNYKEEDGLVGGTNVNGAIHWVFTSPESNQRVVLSFDVKTDEFREIPFPAGAAQDVSLSYRKYSVGDLNGRLCVVYSCFEVHDYIWVMNEHGVTSSWTRIQISLLFRSMRPLCSTKNSDEVLLELNGNIELYNFKTGASRTLRILGANLGGGFESHGFFETHTYVESLISPNSYGVEN